MYIRRISVGEGNAQMTKPVTEHCMSSHKCLNYPKCIDTKPTTYNSVCLGYKQKEYPLNSNQKNNPS